MDVFVIKRDAISMDLLELDMNSLEILVQIITLVTCSMYATKRGVFLDQNRGLVKPVKPDRWLNILQFSSEVLADPLLHLKLIGRIFLNPRQRHCHTHYCISY